MTNYLCDFDPKQSLFFKSCKKQKKIIVMNIKNMD